jgi:hypothetical protein
MQVDKVEPGQFVGEEFSKSGGDRAGQKTGLGEQVRHQSSQENFGFFAIGQGSWSS